MTDEELNRFNQLRKIVAEEIHRNLEDDPCCKSYEGTWELMVSFPNYFEDETATAKPDFYKIELHCYVIGPSRHYEWTGRSWNKCLNKCEKDISAWCKRDSEKNAAVKTYADRVRSMTDEELAEWVWGAETAGRAYGPRGKAAWLDWLKGEAKE